MTPDELIDQLNSANGELYVADPSERVRAQYRRAIHGAKEQRLVPEDLQLWHTGRDRGDMVIRLLKRHAPPRTGTPPQAPPAAPRTLRVPITKQRVKRPTIDLKPALASIAVSKALLPRCRTILQQLADEALQRGYEVLAGVEKSSLVIVANGEHLPFRLFEEQDTAPAPPPTKAELRRYTWRLPPTTIKVPTGRLALRLEHRYRNRTWADRTRWRLEDRLTEVVEHVDSLARAELERQLEAHEKGLRDLEAWEAGTAAARHAYIAALNRRRMRDQAARSGRAHALREFAGRVLAKAAAEADDPSAAAQMLEWQTAILAEAEWVDPVNAPANLRWVDPEEITARDLAAYMPRGMSVYYRPVVPAFPLPASAPAHVIAGVEPPIDFR